MRITNADDGVSAYHWLKAAVRNIIITATRYGVYLATGNDKSEAQLHTISGNEYVYLLNSSPNGTLKQNTITSHGYGVYSYEGVKPTIESNTVTNARIIANSPRLDHGATIKKNTMNFSKYGIDIYRPWSALLARTPLRAIPVRVCI